MSFTKKTVFAAGVALLTLSFPGVVVLRAQQQPAVQQNQETKAAPRPRGPGQELVHETREAAGEEQDETATFKKSASVAFVARITGLSLGNAYLFSVILNFAVVAGIIFWAGRKFLPGVFRARTTAIQKAMQEAQKAGQEARHRLADIEARLMKLDGEIGMMRNAAEQEAAAEEARIHAAAEKDAQKIVEGAQQEIASAVKAARRELTAYAGDLAVGLAKKQIRIDAGTDQAILRGFAGELGSPQISAERPGKDGR
jgi:F-type H+-transporting ATPase subunit b